MSDDLRVKQELLHREIHANEMRTRLRVTRTHFVLRGGGVVLGYADDQESAVSLKEKLSELVICDISITEEWV